MYHSNHCEVFGEGMLVSLEEMEESGRRRTRLEGVLVVHWVVNPGKVGRF